MIATILNVNSLDSLGPLLNYCSAFGRTEEKGGEVIMVNGMTDYAASHLDAAYRAFREDINPRCKHKMKHIIISHHPLDSARIKNDPELERKVLRSFIDEVKKQGIDLERHKFVIYRHSDQAHLHYHMAVCNTDEDGHQMKDYCIGLKIVKAANKVSQMYGLQEAVPENLQRQESERIKRTPHNPDGSRDFKIRGERYHVTHDWHITRYPKQGEPFHEDLSALRAALRERGAREAELERLDWYRLLLGKRMLCTCVDTAFCVLPTNDYAAVKVAHIYLNLAKFGLSLLVMMGKEDDIKNDLRSLHKRVDRFPVVDLSYTDYQENKQHEELKQEQQGQKGEQSSKVDDISATTNEQYAAEVDARLDGLFAQQEQSSTPDSHPHGESRRQRSVREAKARHAAEEKVANQELFDKQFWEYYNNRLKTVGAESSPGAIQQLWLNKHSEDLFGKKLHLYKTHVQDEQNRIFCELPPEYVAKAKEHWGDDVFDRQVGDMLSKAHQSSKSKQHSLDDEREL